MSTKTFPSTGDISDQDLQSLGVTKKQPAQKAAPEKKSTSQPKQAEGINDSDLEALGVKKKSGDGNSAYQPKFSAAPSQQSLLSKADVYSSALKNYQDKKATPEDIDVLSGTDFGKQEGLTGLSPDDKKIFAHAHNGKSVSELNDRTLHIIDNSFPKTGNPKIDAVRENIIKGVQSGDQNVIKASRDKIVSNYQGLIDNIIRARTHSSSGGIGGASTFTTLSEVDKQAISFYKERIKDATDVLNEYSINAAANSKEMQAQVKAEVSGKTYSTGSAIAAQDLGKHIEKITGGLPNPNGNMDYEREKTGINALIQSKEMKLNELITKGMKSKNKGLIDEAKKEYDEIQKYRGWQENLINKYPDVGITQTARLIGDEIDKSESGAQKFNPFHYISKSDVREAANRIEAKHPGFLKKYGKFVDQVAEQQSFFSGIVPTPGISGGLTKGFADVEYSGAAAVAGIVGDKKTREFAQKEEDSYILKGTSKSGEAPSKVVYDDDGKAYIEKDNEDYGKINWNSSTRFIGTSLPGLAQWMIPETAAVGVSKALGATKGASELIGLMAASYATSYDENYKTADKLIEDNSSVGEAKKHIAANLTTLFGAVAFHAIGYSPSKFVENAFTKSISEDAVKMLEDNKWKSLPKTKLEAFIKDVAIPRAKAFGKDATSALKGGATVGAATVADTKIKELVDAIVNPEKAQISSAEDNIKQFTQQAVLMSLIGLPKSVHSGFTSPTMKDAFYDGGLTAPQHIEDIYKKMADGELDKQQGNLAIATLKTMSEEIEKVQSETNSKGLPLTLRQKKEIALQNFRKRAANAMEKDGANISTEKINNDADNSIKDVKSQESHLSAEDTHAFKTAKEIQPEGEETGNGGKGIESVNDIDPEKKYTWQDNDNKEKKGSGAELISFITKSKEYEKPDQGSLSQGSQTEDKGDEAQGKDSKSEGENKIGEPLTTDEELKLKGLYKKIFLKQEMTSQEQSDFIDLKNKKNEFQRKQALDNQLEEGANVNGDWVSIHSGGYKKMGLFYKGENWEANIHNRLGNNILTIKKINTKTGELEIVHQSDHPTEQGAIEEYKKHNKGIEDEINARFDEKKEQSLKEKTKATVESAVIQIGDKVYEGKNHAEAMQKAKDAGEDMSKIDRQRDGQFKLSDGSIIDRKDAMERFGEDHSEQLIKQDDAAKKADDDYRKEKAKSVVDKAIADKKIEGVYSEVAQKDPVKFLKEISDQITGTNADGTKSLQPDAEKATRSQFGDDIVDAAKEMFPMEYGLLSKESKKVKLNESASEEPALPKGENIVTLSGMTEKERQDAIASRRTQTELSENQKSENKLSDLAKKADLARGKEKADLQNKIRQELRKLNTEKGYEKYKYNGAAVVKKVSTRKGQMKEKWRKVNPSRLDSGNQSILDEGVPIRDRSPELQSKFDDLVDIAHSLEIPDASNNKIMSNEQIDAAIQDVYDGIPSVQAELLLNTLEKAVKEDVFPIKGNLLNQAITFNDIVGAEKIIQGQPFDEKNLERWLNEESQLTPEQEQILSDNIENFIYDFPTEIEIESTVSKNDTRPKEGTGEKTKSSTDAKPEIKKSEPIEIRSAEDKNTILEKELGPKKRERIGGKYADDIQKDLIKKHDALQKVIENCL